MSPDNRSRMVEADSRSRHPRKAICVYEIDLIAREHVGVIRAARNDHERNDDRQLEQEQNPGTHPCM